MAPTPAPHTLRNALRRGSRPAPAVLPFVTGGFPSLDSTRALLPRLATPRLPAVLQARLGPLLAAPAGLRGVALGLLLSALPCGLLYGALAGAAATGSALGGALAMVSFVAGTVPALTGVAFLGRFFGKSQGRLMRAVGAGLFVLNGAVLAVMAVRILG